MRSFEWGIFAVVVSACSGSNRAVPCEQDTNCNLSSGGMCIASPGGDSWCAYPDPECPGGYRYSDQSVGDGLASECVGETTHDAGLDAPGSGTWGSPAALANVNSTLDDILPVVSANGLELYFTRFGTADPPYGEIYVATRSSTSQQFGTASPVTSVNLSTENENGVYIAHSGLELFVSRANDIFISTRPATSATFGTPTAIGIVALSYSLTSDDLTLFLVKRCPPGQHNGDGPCLFTSTRSAVGAAWSPPAFLEWPEGNLQWNSADVSGDSLRLLVSNPYSSSAVRAAESRRANINDPWGPLQIIDALSLEGTNGQMRWNATRSEIYLSARPTIPPVGGLDLFVSVLK
jgi:hypothetical protein